MNAIKKILHNPFSLLLLIIIFAAITRVWYFWDGGLHTDELFALELINHDVGYIIQYTLTQDCNPPLFYLIQKASSLIFGINTFAIRIPSVIAGIALIPIIYGLGKEYHNELTGLVAAACCATLGSMWYYSTFGRSYMFICLMFALLTTFYIRLLRWDDTCLNWTVACLTACLLAFTHLFTIIPIAVLFLFLLVQYKARCLKWFGLTILITSPLLLLFNAILINRTDTALSYGMTLAQIVILSPLEFFGFGFTVLIPLVIYGIWVYRERIEVYSIFIAFAASCFILLSIHEVTPVFTRYVLFFIPVMVVIAGMPVSDLIKSDQHTVFQKYIVIVPASIFYIVSIAFSFWGGITMYGPKGPF